MARFYDIDPSLDNYWRAIILFGRNTASYKFALAKALIDLKETGKSEFSLEELAKPYANHLCEHLKLQPKQNTRDQSTFLSNLQNYNENIINHEEMIAQTIRYGFNNVIDAFHNVHGSELEQKFYIDRRKEGKGIELTDNFFNLSESLQFNNLASEVEARWRLVETAWANNISRNIMLVEYEDQTNQLIGVNNLRRTTLTSARSALNGYQKGKCFYCFKEISILNRNENLADVDHFFPHILKYCDNTKPIDGIANLVLACQECNRGANGKFDRLPTTNLLERLFIRNEYLINSHHPLRETLINQTGSSSTKRQDFLQNAYTCASFHCGSTKKWQPKAQGTITF